MGRYNLGVRLIDFRFGLRFTFFVAIFEFNSYSIPVGRKRL